MSYPSDAIGQHRIGQATDLPPNPAEQVWQLRLYVAGQSTCSLLALANLMKLCRQRLPGRHHIEVVDIFEDLTPAINDDIIAVPTVIRRSSTSTRRVAGILSDTDRVISQLQPPGRLTPSQGPQPTAHRPNRQVTDRGNADH